MLRNVADTPIIDLLQEPPAPESKRSRNIVAGFTGICLGILFISLGQQLPSLPGANPLLCLAFWYVAVALHELAHLVVGQVSGFRIHAFAVGGVAAARSGSRLIAQFDWRKMIGGYVKVSPKAGVGCVSAYLRMIAAGPICSVLFAVVSATIWMRWGDGRFEWAGSMFWAASALAALSLIPGSRGLNRTDVSRIRQLLREPDGARGFMGLVSVAAADSSGIRPRDWDCAAVCMMLTSHANSAEKGHRNLLAYYRLIDEGKTSEALDHLETALAHSAPLGLKLRTNVFLEAAYAAAAFKRDAKLSRAWLDRARKIWKTPEADAAEGALAVCEERFADGIHCFERAAALIEKRRLDSGLARFAKEKYAELQRMCREAMAITG